jgi:dynein heavy chain
VRFYVHSIQKHAADNALECDEFKQPYASFSHLWTRDIAGAVKDFLVEKAVPIEEEAAAAAEGEGAPKEEGKASSFGGALAPTPEPALADFDEQIDLYRRQALDIGALSTSATRGWLKLDAKPVKQALSTWVTKWKFAYTQHLQTSVIDRLSELKAFMEATVGGLATEVEPDDVAALVQAMTFIRDVRVRTDTIDALFEPLRGTVALLKKYSITLSESTMELLENAPFQWEDTKKATLNAREKLNPLQALQAEKIKEEAEDFGYRVSDFRKVRAPATPIPHVTPHSPYLTPRLRLPQGVPRRRRRRAVQARVRRGVLCLARPLAPQDRRARGRGGDAQREVRALRRGGGAVQGDQAVPPGHPRAQARVGPRRARRAHLRRLALDAVAR